MGKQEKKEYYINIQSWMIQDLELSGNELNLYAMIHGYSQNGEGEYYGSQRYISKALLISLPTANSLINKLVNKGLVRKTSESHYVALKKLKHPVKETLTPSVKETLTNNNNTNNNIAKKFETKVSGENIKNNLISLEEKKKKVEGQKKEKEIEKVEDSFSMKEYIKTMREEKSLKHIKLIGWYFQTKGVFFPDKKTIQIEIRRWLADASFIVKYPPADFERAYARAKDITPDNWNLSTIKKYISYKN